MLISTEIESLKRYDDNKPVLKLLKDAGFEAYDFSMFYDTPHCLIFDDDYLEKAQELRRYADEIGIVCNQAHAPFPTFFPSDKNYADFVMRQVEQASGKPFPSTEHAKEEYETLIDKLIRRCLEISGILGAKICVVHPQNPENAQTNAKFYSKFIDSAKQANVMIAVENMYDWCPENHAVPAACYSHEDFKAHLDLLDKDVFCACLDVGHAEMFDDITSATTMIRTLGNRLKCLHIHDNDKRWDLHTLPMSSKIDFESICDALAEIGYDGDLTLEASYYPMRFPPEFLPNVMRYMYEVTDFLRKKILAKK